MKRPQTMWDDGSWWVFIPGKNREGRVYWPGQWVRYEDLCAAFPGFREFWTPEPDEPAGDQQ